MVRSMEPATWASLSDDELLEKKISQLGLKLERTREPIDVLVIDRVDHPQPN